MVQAFGKLNPVIPNEVEESRNETFNVRPRDPSTSLRSAQDDGVDLSLVDAASFAAHKFYGPKGAGLLFLRSGLSIQPIMFGGAHENERRPGTENVPAIAGMAAAAGWINQERKLTTASPSAGYEQEKEKRMRDELWKRIARIFPDAMQNGHLDRRLTNTLNVSFPGIDSETMLMALDLEGVCASSGSACMAGSVVASHVLLAMGLSMECASSAIRFSIGKWTTEKEIEAAAEAIERICDRLAKAKRNDYAAV